MGGDRVQCDVDPVIEYVFGVGDGHTTSWHGVADTDPDADGSNEAIRLDFDGDSRRDDLLWDTDGDAVADVAALDLDDDGQPDHYFSDDGTGVWGVLADRPQVAATRGPDPTPNPRTTAVPPATPQSRDLDGDGIGDVELVLDHGAVRRLYIDEDGDGEVDRVLVDTNADGTADVSYRDDAPEFGR